MKISISFSQEYHNDSTKYLFHNYERFISEYIEQQYEIIDDSIFVFNFQEHYPYLVKSDTYDGSSYSMRYTKTDSPFYMINNNVVGFFRSNLDYKSWFLDLFVLDKFDKSCEQRLKTEVGSNFISSISYSQTSWIQFFTDLIIGENHTFIPTTIEIIEKKQNKVFYERKLLIIGYSKEKSFFIDHEYVLLEKRTICE